MKKFGVLFVALLVGLGLVGATYAYWTDKLTVSGSVSMGTLNVEFVGTAVGDDNEDDLGLLDVGNVACQLKDSKTLQISISEAYPGYVATCQVTIKNTGSIPANYVLTKDVSNLPSSISVDVSGIAETGTLSPEETKTLTITTTVDSNADETIEGQTYTYSITIDVTQFNYT